TITVPRARTPALRARHPAVPLLPAARRYLRHSTASSSPAPTLSGPGPTFAFPPHLGPAPPPAAPRASPRLPAYPGPRCHGDVEVGLHRGEVRSCGRARGCAAGERGVAVDGQGAGNSSGRQDGASLSPLSSPSAGRLPGWSAARG